MLPEGNGHSDGSSQDGLWLAALHDLRQPIQSALLLVSSAGEDDVADRRRRSLQLAELALLGLQSMLEELSAASRLAGGGGEVGARQEALGGVVAAAAAEFRGVAGSEAIELDLDRAAASLVVDGRIFRSLALGLLATALKFRRDGAAEFKARYKNGRLVLSTDLETAALPEAILASYFVELPLAPAPPPLRLFAPGLGLARHIVQALGGRLAVRQAAPARKRLSLSVSPV